jgi:hypothetical protein
VLRIRAMSALSPKADIHRCACHVRFGPEADISPCNSQSPMIIGNTAPMACAHARSLVRRAGCNQPSIFAVGFGATAG